MKLVSYLIKGKDRLGILYNDRIYDMEMFIEGICSMKLFLDNWSLHYPKAIDALEKIKQGKINEEQGFPLHQYSLTAPVPCPTSCRDGYAFRQHVAAARRNRKVPMIPEFDQYPIFYFTNHNSIMGPGDLYCMPDHFHKLDFELEAAIVICKKGRNIKAEEADQYIGGLMIMNDMSARTLQMEEMLLNLGPAKGKDFATVIGPWLVTLDELKPYEVPAKENHIGKNWNLRMQCRVNGELLSDGNVADMDWTFAEIIERVSYGVDIFPGDVIGSGTVGTGCLLELNGTAKLENPDYQERWLKEGDVVEMEITGLGILTNTIRAEKTQHSLLAKKKI